MSASYRVAPIILIRMAGVPFDLLDALATTDTAAAGRELLVRRNAFDAAKHDVEQLLQKRGHGLSEELFRAWRKAIRTGTMPPATDGVSEAFSRCWGAAAALAAAEAELASALERELFPARKALLSAANAVLPPYLVFVAGALRERLAAQSSAAGAALGPRNKEARAHERHLLLYLQRIAAKNDSLSAFGPEGWGEVLENGRGLRLSPVPGIAERHTFMERWTAHGVAAAVNADPATPAKLQVPAMVPFAFQALVDDVKLWPPGEPRTRWLAALEPIAALPEKFAANPETSARTEIMRDADARLSELGIERKASDRFLYSAGNPIGEECFRECGLKIGRELINEVADDAAPWIDLWRDCYAFVGSRVAAGLRELLKTAPVSEGAVTLSAFLQHCAASKAPLHGPAMVAMAHAAFSEVKAAFREHFRDRADAEEWELRPEDCRFIRERFQYPTFDEYTYPSADLQIAAKSVASVNRGEYQWVLAELHPPVAMLHHGFYWSCPDKAALSDALASTTRGIPSFHFGFYAADFTATTTVRQFDALPDLVNFVAPQRSQPGWRTFAPDEINVVFDSANGDVGLRSRAKDEYLGSFARAWMIPLGFHPFLFSRPPHTPRLRCGKVIVQRRSWTVTLAEFPAGKFQGVSRELVVAVEQLRAAKGWPRHVYIRPTEGALRRSGGEGRDKDTKPVYIDLESYLFLEVFHRWLVKSGELEVSEMLPDPDQLLWNEADGRRTFELRTLIVPRS